MEIVFTVLLYLFVIGCVLLLPFLLFVTMRVIAERSKRLSLIMAGALLGIELLAAGILYIRPIYICSSQYEIYITEETEAQLKAGYLPASRGFWSKNVPFIAVVNEVFYADESEIYVRTWYFPFGRSNTGVSDDGLFPIY